MSKYTEKCQNCKYHGLGDGYAEMTCRRYAPTRKVGTPDETGKYTARWPSVSMFDFCGEFEAREVDSPSDPC